MNLGQKLQTLVFLVIAATLTACSGGGGGGGSSSSLGPRTSPSITANGFISALNNVDGASFPFDNYMVKDQFDTLRTDEDWFVIWDAEYNENVAVSLQYLRSIVYFDYFSSNNGLAREYRAINADDAFFNGIIGDGFGNNYEIVDYAGDDAWGNAVYVGYDSGLFYEDEQDTFDVSLMASEKETKEFFQKAANVSFAYSINIETSLALVTLGQKVEQMLDQSKGEITAEDQMALMNDLTELSGVTLDDVQKAAFDNKAKEELISDVANRIGTTATNLEQRILPEVFGYNF